jgi:hypothetical protein
VTLAEVRNEGCFGDSELAILRGRGGGEIAGGLGWLMGVKVE